MATNLKPLRILVIVILVLLFFQYELGITVNFSNPLAISPFNFSVTAFRSALDQVGIVALLHAGLGGWLVIFAVINLIFALRTKIRSVQIYGVLSFLSIVFAAGGGLFFVLSGFQDDHASHAMATNFILSFALFFLELYAMRPESKSKTN